MKKIFALTLALLALVTFTKQVNAQTTPKFAHIDSQELLSVMPERAAAKTTLENFAKQLEDRLTAMQSEFEKKYNEYLATADTLPPLIRQNSEEELSGLQQRIQNFQQNAQQQISQKENELLQPIIAKARAAIDEVANEKGYIYVFDIGTGVVLFHSAESEDILPFVKTKLGIK